MMVLRAAIADDTRLDFPPSGARNGRLSTRVLLLHSPLAYIGIPHRQFPRYFNH
jgi:hypothetical protein